MSHQPRFLHGFFSFSNRVLNKIALLSGAL